MWLPTFHLASRSPFRSAEMGQVAAQIQSFFFTVYRNVRQSEKILVSLRQSEKILVSLRQSKRRILFYHWSMSFNIIVFYR